MFRYYQKQDFYPLCSNFHLHDTDSLTWLGRRRWSQFQSCRWFDTPRSPRRSRPTGTRRNWKHAFHSHLMHKWLYRVNLGSIQRSFSAFCYKMSSPLLWKTPFLGKSFRSHINTNMFYMTPVSLYQSHGTFCQSWDAPTQIQATKHPNLRKERESWSLSQCGLLRNRLAFIIILKYLIRSRNEPDIKILMSGYIQSRIYGPHLKKKIKRLTLRFVFLFLCIRQWRPGQLCLLHPPGNPEVIQTKNLF